MNLILELFSIEVVLTIYGTLLIGIFSIVKSFPSWFLKVEKIIFFLLLVFGMLFSVLGVGIQAGFNLALKQLTDKPFEHLLTDLQVYLPFALSLVLCFIVGVVFTSMAESKR